MAVRKRKPSDDFETERQNLLRTFEVEFMDGTKRFVFAHFHDAGGNGRCISFVTIETSGVHRISDTFAIHALKSLHEIVTGELEDGAEKLAS